MATSAAVIGERQDVRRRTARIKRGLDAGMLTGIAIAVIALAVGVAISGISARYFFQPTSMLIVVGGTLGVMLITTPYPMLLHSLRRTAHLFSKPDRPDREKLIEEIVGYARVVRVQGILAIEPELERVSHGFLRDALLLAMDSKDHNELQSALESKIRLCERQSEAAARVLEVAGGLTPTIGVLGTVVGLIDVLRQFSSLSAVASGVGAAFTSTFYGLALANVALLPLAHRIRAWAAETFELQELMTEGALCLFDGTHPRLARQRLCSYWNAGPDPDRSVSVEPAPEALHS